MAYIPQFNDLSEEDKIIKEKIDARNSLDSYLHSMRNTIEDKEKLADIAQQNVDELKNYSGKANQAFAELAKEINQALRIQLHWKRFASPSWLHHKAPAQVW